ncbi:hypothetical protein HG530_009039 [Fusarium avenaceum]|nr:hypothetical protein HG530_009039 [Fusarium avenaceum]
MCGRGGYLHLDLQLSDAVKVGLSVTHSGFECLDLEDGRTEMLVALSNRATGFAVLLLEASKLFLCIDRNGLESFEFLRPSVASAASIVGQTVGNVHLSQVRKQCNGAVQLVSAGLLLQLQLVQSVLVLGELLNSAVCHIVNKAITHTGHPDELVRGIASSKYVILVPRMGLSIETFFDKAVEEVCLEGHTTEAKQGEDRVLILLEGVGEEELQNLQVLLSLLSLQSS